MLTLKTGVQKKSIGETCKLFFVFAAYRSFNFVLSFLQKLLYSNPPAPSRVLIFRTGSLGDNLCAIPAMVAIRRKFPNAQLDILTNAGKTNLVTLDKLLDSSIYDSLIDYLGQGIKKLFPLLRKNKYGLVIYLPQTDSSFFRLIRDLLFFRFVSAGGFGWEKATIHFFRRTQEKFIFFQNETTRLNHLMEKNGITVRENKFPLNIHEEDGLLVNELFRKNFLDKKEKNIAMVVGAKRPQNRWPLVYFKEVIDYFSKEYNIIIIGGPEDRILTEPFQTMENVFDFSGLLTPIQSALVFKKCLLTLSNDTGPMHLSYVMETPTVALFSSRDFPGKWFPPENKFNKVFRTENVSCSICLSEICPNNAICIKAINPKEVINGMCALIALLKTEYANSGSDSPNS
jgi:ADP-heptose:LPS heptosyltransferase